VVQVGCLLVVVRHYQQAILLLLARVAALAAPTVLQDSRQWRWDLRPMVAGLAEAGILSHNRPTGAMADRAAATERVVRVME
jgi:hypothetical protein